jgi:hypothetical protein
MMLGHFLSRYFPPPLKTLLCKVKVPLHVMQFDSVLPVSEPIVAIITGCDTVIFAITENVNNNGAANIQAPRHT